jgi:2-phosphosulfolactate phosphatase
MTQLADPPEAGPAASGPPPWAAQDGYAFRFDWGPNGLRNLARHADVLVVVDVLRFTTAVSVALEQGGTVLPYRWKDEGAAAFAAEHGALLAEPTDPPEGSGRWSLSPSVLRHLPRGTRLVLPSPNGAALVFAAKGHGARMVLTASLRNASAVGRFARAFGGADGVVAVLAAGERWNGATGPLRPAVEDLICAGAVLTALDPAGSISAPGCSPEAQTARAAFVAARPRLHELLADAASGRELIGRGRGEDVRLAAQLDVATTVPLLRDGALVDAGATPPQSAVRR